MMSRLLPVLAVSLVLSIAGCSDAGDTGSSADTGSGPVADRPQSDVEVPPEPPKVQYADLPGGEVVHQMSIDPAAVRVKPIESVWAPEFADQSAKAGEHFLVVYIAVAPALDDRGVEKVDLTNLRVRFRPSTGQCESQAMQVEGEKHCFPQNQILTDMAELADGAWRDHKWRTISGTKLAKGQTKVGAATFAIPDTLDALAGYELCAPTKEKSFTLSDYPCTPIKVPARPKG